MTIITLAKGEKHEKKVEIKPPVGRKARKKFQPLMNVILDLASAGEDDMITAVKQITNHPDYEDVYLPLMLNLEDRKGQKWLDENGEPMELFQAFMEALPIVMGGDVNRPEVEAATKK